MHRIDTKTAQKDKFGAGKNGFTRGNPQTGTPATDLDDDYFDMLQEELCSVVEASGASLEKGRHDQLLTALRALLLSRKNPFGDIKSDGTVKTALENLGLGASAFGIQNRVVISATGVTQWSVPDVLKKGRKCKVKVIGAGGSGGIGNATTAAGQAAIAGGGGGAGGISESLLDLTGIDSVTVTVGVGGTPVTSLSTNGVSGGTSSFGSYLSATGGIGGGQPSGGESGIGTGGDTNSSGGPGSPGGVLNADNNGVPSMCGGSGGGPGGNGAAQVSATNKAADAKAPGGGGAGLKPSSGSGITSGRGGNGLVIIEW
ncbi:hypothetical protein KOK65_003230 [Escherichia coli]|nr:hypothetical protein [Escherichia coli]EHS7009265.1 hypothetical protein [Escherichia coli]EJB6746495.1 hypothetical protein [Escherichia coli]